MTDEPDYFFRLGAAERTLDLLREFHDEWGSTDAESMPDQLELWERMQGLLDAHARTVGGLA